MCGRDIHSILWILTCQACHPSYLQGPFRVLGVLLGGFLRWEEKKNVTSWIGDKFAANGCQSEGGVERKLRNAEGRAPERDKTRYALTRVTTKIGDDPCAQ